MPEPDHRRLMELEVRTPSGSVDGPMDLHALRQRIYEGVYRGREELRVRGEAWGPISAWPRLQEVFALVDVDLGSLAIGQQHVKGWKKRAEPGPTVAPPPRVVRPSPPPRARPAQPPDRGGFPWLGVVIGLGALAAAVALFLKLRGG